MDVAYKLSVLNKLAREFNAKSVRWAVGGSLLLYLKGVVTEFNDLDIMVDECDIDVVRDIVSNFCEIQQRLPNSKYKTKHFLECNVDGVDVDIMAGFTIVQDGMDYSIPFSVCETIELHGETIPLQSIDVWRNNYMLMEREGKVSLIDEWKSKKAS